MIPRTPEPEVMDDAAEAAEYDAMDHSAVNRLFVDDLIAFAGGPIDGDVIDVGGGTALIPIELATRCPKCRVACADASAAMLERAQENIDAAGLRPRQVVTVPCDSRLVARYQSHFFDVVMSNSLIHHLPDDAENGESAITATFREFWRLAKPGGVIFVRDLLRPNSDAAVEHLVSTYAGDETAFAQQLFRQSLHAALTVAEVKEIISEIGIPPEHVAASSDRHWTLATRKPA